MGRNFNLENIFESLLKVVGMGLCFSTLGLNGGAKEIFGVLGCFREKY